MQDQIIDSLPAHWQTILNAVGFLLAAVIAWYGYFIKGKKEANEPLPQTAPNTPLMKNVFDPEVMTSVAGSISRLADSMEEFVELTRSNAIEEEIERRVERRVKDRVPQRKARK